MNARLQYARETSEKLVFSDVFRGHKSGTLFENGSTNFSARISSSKKLFKICWIASNVVMKASTVRILYNIFSFGVRYLRDRL